MSRVPLVRRDFGFFDRQRDLFSDWLKEFDNEWRAMDFDDSFRRFNRELERAQREMHQLSRSSDRASRLLEVDTPFVTDPQGKKKLSLRFDCAQFKPEEVSVKVKDKNLTVQAKHDEEKHGEKIHREFQREFSIPEDVDAQKLKATLMDDGVLSIEAPAPPSIVAPKEFLIPVEKLK